MTRLILLACIAFTLAACSSPKPPPGWPEGPERPINAKALPHPAASANAGDVR